MQPVSHTPIGLWDLYGDLLWEESQHKSTCLGYAIEISAIMERHRRQRYDNTLIDLLVGEFRARGNRNSTINRKLACLSKLLRKHHRNGLLDRLPDLSKLPEKNGRIRFLTYQEEDHLIGALRAIAEDHADLAVFLVNSGARVGEALKLDWGDITERHCTFWDTKAGVPRTIPLTDSAISVLEARRDRKSGPFRAIRYANFRNAWLKARKRAAMEGDRDVVPHILRHTCASRLAQAGVDIKRIQEFLGHRTLAMTLRYAHLCPSHLDVCSAALNRQQSRQRRRARPEKRAKRPPNPLAPEL